MYLVARRVCHQEQSLPKKLPGPRTSSARTTRALARCSSKAREGTTRLGVFFGSPLCRGSGSDGYHSFMGESTRVQVMGMSGRALFRREQRLLRALLVQRSAQMRTPSSRVLADCSWMRKASSAKPSEGPEFSKAPVSSSQIVARPLARSIVWTSFALPFVPQTRCRPGPSETGPCSAGACPARSSSATRRISRLPRKALPCVSAMLPCMSQYMSRTRVRRAAASLLQKERADFESGRL